MISYNNSNSWRKSKSVYCKSGETWREVGQISYKENGAWRNIWSYRWITGAWGGCSASCGDGTQYRDAYCQRVENNTGEVTNVADNKCIKYVGSKPATSQYCNNGPCKPVSTGQNIVISLNTDCGVIARPIQSPGEYGYSAPYCCNYSVCANSYHPNFVDHNAGRYTIASFYNTAVQGPWFFIFDFKSRCGGSNWANMSLVSGQAKVYACLGLLNGYVPPLYYPGYWQEGSPNCWNGPGCNAPAGSCGWHCGHIHGDTGDCGSMLFAVAPTANSP